MSVVPHASLTVQFEVKIDGAPLQGPRLDGVDEIVVDENLHLPAMATVRFHLTDLSWLDSIKEGQQLEIAAKEQATTLPLFKGKIAAIEPDLSAQLRLLTVRAYDLSYALHRKRFRRAFIQVTDSDLASRLAQEGGVRVAADSTSPVHEYIFQNNQSNYEFLRERAIACGYDFYFEDGTLHFKKPYATRGATTELIYGQNLERFRPRVTTFEPPNEVQVLGWDPKTKQQIVGKATTPRGSLRLGDGDMPAARSAASWGGSLTYTVTDRVVESRGEADVLAASYLDELGGSFVEAQGVCLGGGQVRPGRTVNVKLDDLTKRFSTEYLVTSATHRFTPGQGHMTEFAATSRRAGTVHELVNGTRPQPSWPGPVIAIVTNIADPDKKGRVKVKFPWLADDQESHWARIATALTGNARGFYSLPEINDEVLVMFEQGDMRRPLIIGGLWNYKDLPPVPPSLPGGRDSEILTNDSKVKNRLFKSTTGNMLIFNDSDNAPGVFLVGKSGAYIMVDDENGKEKIALTDKTRKDRIEIRSEDGSIHIECEGDIIIETKKNLKATVQGNAEITVQGNLTAKATGTADITSTGALTLKSSATVNIEATAGLTLKGATVTMEGQGPVNVKGALVTVEGQGMTTVKGGMVTVQGSGPTVVKGTPLALN